jgi:DNA mismatch repair protein MutL
LGEVAVLDPLVAQQVAAGEIVDRPAFVVKELSGDALEADVARTEVELAGGRRAFILLEVAGKLPAYHAGI